jgi:hypothetical protein
MRAAAPLRGLSQSAADQEKSPARKAISHYARPRASNRSVRAVKPETSTKTEVPSTLRSRSAGFSASRFFCGGVNLYSNFWLAGRPLRVGGTAHGSH